MAVAKSYIGLKQIGKPYEINGKMYVKVETKLGMPKQVRWYTDAEFEKMYGVAPGGVPVAKTEKEALGFENGFIHIFKGDTYSSLDWFRQSICKYNKIFGWYCPSTESLPENIPSGLEPIKIFWKDVCVINSEGKEEDTLKPQSIVKEWCETFLYESSNSNYVGAIGERLELTLKIIKRIELDGIYGRSSMHIMSDAEGNIFVWTTTAKQLIVDEEYQIRGTVKRHDKYKNEKQTILTRCIVLN